jgi:SNF2 family DNA or RNA helicase
MILSPRAGGVGLTLTSANHVIHLSRWWNPAVEDQCTDRVYRIGQDQTVMSIIQWLFIRFMGMRVSMNY